MALFVNVFHTCIGGHLHSYLYYQDFIFTPALSIASRTVSMKSQLKLAQAREREAHVWAPG
jgi:hypothetical protein